MKNVYAVWEGERTRSYITPGKKYEASEINDYGFSMVCDDGELIQCLWKKCAHLDRGNWTRIEEDDEAPQPMPVPAPEPQPEQKTLRDEFALNWLLGYMSSPKTPHLSYQEAAETAYKTADAMLEARKK